MWSRYFTGASHLKFVDSFSHETFILERREVNIPAAAGFLLLSLGVDLPLCVWQGYGLPRKGLGNQELVRIPAVWACPSECRATQRFAGMLSRPLFPRSCFSFSAGLAAGRNESPSAHGWAVERLPAWWTLAAQGGFPGPRGRPAAASCAFSRLLAVHRYSARSPGRRTLGLAPKTCLSSLTRSFDWCWVSLWRPPALLLLGPWLTSSVCET